MSLDYLRERERRGRESSLDIPRFWYSFLFSVSSEIYTDHISHIIVSFSSFEPSCRTVGSALGGTGVIIDPSPLAYPLDLPTYLPTYLYQSKKKEFSEEKSFFLKININLWFIQHDDQCCIKRNKTQSIRKQIKKSMKNRRIHFWKTPKQSHLRFNC